MKLSLTQGNTNLAKFLPLRCGLCNKVVREKSWEEHLESKEHKFRVVELMRIIVDNSKKYGHPFIVDATNDVRANVDKPETVEFT